MSINSQSPLLLLPVFEHHHSGFGVNHSRPRISWRFINPVSSTSLSNWAQSAYDIEITPITSKNLQTETFHVKSNDSVLVPWPGKPLQSRDSASVRVRAYGLTGVPTNWSESSYVEAALLDQEDWQASFVAPSIKFELESGSLRPLIFLKSFALPLDKPVRKARLYITSLGVYEASINGSRVGDHVLAPGWTSYRHRLNYQTFDVTKLLLQAENMLKVEVAEGWYAGRLCFSKGRRHIYGNELAVSAQLEITFEQGEMYTVSTDLSWKFSPYAILQSELYDGETYDMQQEHGNLQTLIADDSKSFAVKAIPRPSATLISPDSPPVKVTEQLKPINIFTSKSGKTIIDFGQNLVGTVQIRSLQIPAGQSVTLSHAEVLEDGEIAIRPLRYAKCVDTIISSGNLLENWNPKFTFHGFRYVQVDGWMGLPSTSDFTALVIHTDLRRRGWFSCSDPLVNKLHENVVWSMRGNFLSIPTDCPQRDERLGWTGDIQVFCSTANFLYDTIGMLSNWMEDVSAEQLAKDNGIPGLVVPDVLPERWKPAPQAVWHDVVVLTPWDLYTSSGDSELLRKQYNSMKTWIDKAIRRGPDGLWDPDIWQLGDWLDPSAPPEDPGHGRTDGVLVADAYLLHITSTFAAICSIIGNQQEATQYNDQVTKLRLTFQHKYITNHGMLVNNTQTGLSLALKFDLYRNLTPEQHSVAAACLGNEVGKSKFNIATGFAGTPVVCYALTATGQIQLAYRMLLEKHCPSWLYPVTMGATSIWERWDSMLPDGKINPGSMTSFNHYALGSIASWLHDTVGGISSDDGWRTVRVCPIPGGSIDHADVVFEGPYGLVKCSWRVSANIFTMDITIPPNSKAIVKLPAQQAANGAARSGEIIEVGSGQYSYSCAYIQDQWPPVLAQEPFWGHKLCDCCK